MSTPPFSRPVSRPLLPTLLRMSVGLLLAVLGGVLVWQGSTLHPTPGLRSVTTPFAAPLDGPLPLDVAQDARLRFQGEVGELQFDLSPLPASSPDVLRGEARHRERNPLVFSDSRRARTLDVLARLDVRPFRSVGVVVNRPEPFIHRVQAGLTSRIPLTLSTRTGVGRQNLDLRTLRLRALTARTERGGLTVALPARPSGPLALTTNSGDVRVSAPPVPGQPGAWPEALRVNSRAGDLTLELAGVQVGSLNVGSGSGSVRLTLPARTDRGSLTTTSGDVTVTALPGSTGNLDIRTGSGTVTLNVPADLRVRVRFTDRETLTWPQVGSRDQSGPERQPESHPESRAESWAESQSEPLAIQLDVFVDAPANLFHLKTLRPDTLYRIPRRPSHD